MKLENFIPNLYTHVPLISHQAVQFGTGQRVVMPRFRTVSPAHIEYGLPLPFYHYPTSTVVVPLFAHYYIWSLDVVGSDFGNNGKLYVMILLPVQRKGIKIMVDFFAAMQPLMAC